MPESPQWEHSAQLQEGDRSLEVFLEQMAFKLRPGAGIKHYSFPEMTITKYHESHV